MLEPVHDRNWVILQLLTIDDINILRLVVLKPPFQMRRVFSRFKTPRLIISDVSCFFKTYKGIFLPCLKAFQGPWRVIYWSSNHFIECVLERNRIIVSSHMLIPTVCPLGRRYNNGYQFGLLEQTKSSTWNLVFVKICCWLLKQVYATPTCSRKPGWEKVHIPAEEKYCCLESYYLTCAVYKLPINSFGIVFCIAEKLELLERFLALKVTPYGWMNLEKGIQCRRSSLLGPDDKKVG